MTAAQLFGLRKLELGTFLQADLSIMVGGVGGWVGGDEGKWVGRNEWVDG